MWKACLDITQPMVNQLYQQKTTRSRFTPFRILGDSKGFPVGTLSVNSSTALTWHFIFTRWIIWHYLQSNFSFPFVLLMKQGHNLWYNHLGLPFFPPLLCTVLWCRRCLCHQGQFRIFAGYNSYICCCKTNGVYFFVITPNSVLTHQTFDQTLAMLLVFPDTNYT